MVREILKQNESFSKILKDIKEGRESHTFLFISKDEFTAKEMARLIANALLCQDLCGHCENCIKFNLEHPDVKYFPKKEKLLVEDSNVIVEESFVKPIFAERKIFIIDNFDKSTVEAQNKLLKVLEEPNYNMYYLLSTANLEAVLPTIRSRCFKVEIGPQRRELINEVIKQVGSNQRDLAISLGDAYLGKTIELAKKNNLENIFNLSLDIICKLKSSKEVILYSKRILDEKGDICLIFECISRILEDLIAVKTGNSDLIKFGMYKDKLKDVQEEYSLKAISEIEKLIINVMKKIEFMTNVTLVVDNFLMNMLEVKYLCK